MEQMKSVDGEETARIDKVQLRKSLGDRLIGHRLLYFLTLPSTNRHARELAEDGWPEGTIVMAEEQTAGRGRSGRSWHSPPGVGIYCSLLLKPSLPPEKVPLLTLVAAIGAVLGLREIGIDAEIKWPNDLMLRGRKIGGILAETRFRPSAPPEVVLGIGLNVNHREEHLPPALLPAAGSVLLVTGRESSRTEVLTSILIHIDRTYERLRSGEEQQLLEQFVALCPMASDTAITVQQGSESVSGRTSGIAPTGALRLATASGILELHAGEARLAGAPDAARG